MMDTKDISNQLNLDLNLSAQDINNLIRKNPGKQVFFSEGDAVKESIIKDISFEGLDFGESKSIDVSNDSSNPIIGVVNSIIEDAVLRNASDIHIDPKDNSVLIRYRIHGTLVEALKLEQNVSKFLNARIKIMSSLNITEKRRPQDGKAMVSVNGHKLDLRISFIPSTHGERCVIRILNTGLLNEIMESSRGNERFKKVLDISKSQNGMLIVCGPTGSGKSTTMYGILNEINSPSVNILTIEDPVEYDFNDIAQSQVDDENGMGFVDGLRSILRQDPDVIMIGEIRDMETAKMAVQSSLTGHMVFTTLHTNTAIGAISRMRNLGIDSHLLSSSLTGVVSQRLMRTLCECCQDSNVSIKINGRVIKESKKATGCDLCNFTGYRGRNSVYGIVVVTPELKDALSSEASELELMRISGDDGMFNEMVSLVENGKSDLSELELYYKN